MLNINVGGKIIPIADKIIEMSEFIQTLVEIKEDDDSEEDQEISLDINPTHFESLIIKLLSENHNLTVEEGEIARYLLINFEEQDDINHLTDTISLPTFTGNGLLALVANGGMNRFLNVDNMTASKILYNIQPTKHANASFSWIYDTLETNKPFEVNRLADYYDIMYIESAKLDHLTEIEFVLCLYKHNPNRFDRAWLSLTPKYIRSWNTLYHDGKKEHDKWIQLPTNPLFLIALHYTSAFILFKSDKQFDIGICTRFIYQDTDERRMTAQTNHSHIFIFPLEFSIMLPTTYHHIKYTITEDLWQLRNIVINCKYLTSVSFKVNNEELFNVGADVLHEMISKTALGKYPPKDYYVWSWARELKQNEYTGSLPLKKDTKLELILNTSIDTNAYVIFERYKLMIHAGGMGDARELPVYST